MYGPEILQLLVNKEPPATICTQITLCKSSKVAKLANTECAACEWIMAELEQLLSNNATEAEIIIAVEKVCTYLPSSLTGVCQQLVAMYGPQIVQEFVNNEDPAAICAKLDLCKSSEVEMPEAPATLECAVCEWVMAELEQLVSSNSTETEIIDALEKVCTYLPSSIQSACDDLVAMYGPEILQLLVNKEDPATICTQLTLCKSSKVAKPEAPANLECALCELVMSELEKFVSDNSTETEIIDALEKVCSYLPTSVQSACDDLIAMYGPEILQLLVNKEPPATICTQITLCKSSKVAEPEAPATVECALCEFVLAELEKLVVSNATEVKIINAIETVCNYLPSTYVSVCDDFISVYGPEILQNLVNKEDPNAVCGNIGVCPKTEEQALPIIRAVA
jgi:saposin